MTMMLKMKNRSQRYDINRPRPAHGPKYTKCKMCLSIMMVLRNRYATFEAQFMKKLSNTEAELKKSVAYKKKRVNFFQNKTKMTLDTNFESMFFNPFSTKESFLDTEYRGSHQCIASHA